MSTRSVPLDCFDDLNQLKDELHVVWCALTNPDHGVECVLPIAEHVNGIKNRLRAVIATMEGAAPMAEVREPLPLGIVNEDYSGTRQFFMNGRGGYYELGRVSLAETLRRFDVYADWVKAGNGSPRDIEDATPKTRSMIIKAYWQAMELAHCSHLMPVGGVQ